MSLMEPIRFEINVPPGGITMTCTECRGDRAVMVQYASQDSDGNAGTTTVFKSCKFCKGTGRMGKFQPPM